MQESGEEQVSDEEFGDLLLCARYGETEDLERYLSTVPDHRVTALMRRQDERGNSMLHFCAANGHTETVRLLVRYASGAAPSSTATDTTTADSQTERPAKGKTRERQSAKDGRENAAMEGETTDSAVNLQNEGGNTALHWAALNGHLDVIKLLVEVGKVGTDVRNKMGRMAIDEAEAQGKESVVLWLLALDMKREKEAGLYDDKDEQVQGSVEGQEQEGEGDHDGAMNTTSGDGQDVSIAISAGQVEAGEKYETAHDDTVATQELSKAVDEMDMLD